MFTIIGAILGSVAGGVMTSAAFFAALGALASRGEGDEMGHLAFALMIVFTVPVFLLGNIIGATIGALAGAPADRRRGKRQIVRKVLRAAYTGIGTLFVAFALLATLFVFMVSGERWVIGAGIGGIAVGVGLCLAGWRVGREMPSVEQAERMQHG